MLSVYSTAPANWASKNSCNNSSKAFPRWWPYVKAWLLTHDTPVVPHDTTRLCWGFLRILVWSIVKLCFETRCGSIQVWPFISQMNSPRIEKCILNAPKYGISKNYKWQLLHSIKEILKVSLKLTEFFIGLRKFIILLHYGQTHWLSIEYTFSKKDSLVSLWT